MKRCANCKKDKHEDYDNDIKMTTVYKDGEYIKRSYMCGSHRMMYGIQGFQIKIKEL